MDGPHWGRFHTGDLQWFLKPYQNYIATRTRMIQVPLSVRQSLRWWTVTSNLNRGKKINIDQKEHIVTDASLSGWGAFWNGSPLLGRWLAAKAQLPINLLKLRDIRRYATGSTSYGESMS